MPPDSPACDVVSGLSRRYDTFFQFGREKETKSAATMPYFDGDYWPGSADDLLANIEANGLTRGDEVLVQLRHHTDWLGGPEDSSLIDGMPTHSNKSLLTPGAKSLLEELLLQGRGDAKLYRRGSLMAMQRTAMAAGCEQQRAAKGLR